jgi:hypothetical protein
LTQNPERNVGYISGFPERNVGDILGFNDRGRLQTQAIDSNGGNVMADYHR